eukprot:1159765-Pelagomonas_calceolata.AAC.22
MQSKKSGTPARMQLHTQAVCPIAIAYFKSSIFRFKSKLKPQRTVTAPPNSVGHKEILGESAFTPVWKRNTRETERVRFIGSFMHAKKNAMEVSMKGKPSVFSSAVPGNSQAPLLGSAHWWAPRRDRNHRHTSPSSSIHQID